MLKRYHFLMILGLLLSIASTTQAELQTTQFTLTYDTVDRTYHVYEPEGEANRILIALHDFASSARALEVITGLNAVADKYGFIVVYPDAVNYYWDDGRIAYGVTPDDGSVDDAGFLAALRDELISTYAIESDQVFLTGIGSGGQMAFTAACLQSDLYGGVIVVSTLLWDYHSEHCAKDASPIPVNLLIVHGSRDAFYQTDGFEFDTSNGSRTLLGTQETLAFFGERNACNPASLITDAAITQYEECDAVTALVNIEGSGGQWPRVDDFRLNDFGVDASDVIGAFITDADWQSLTTQTTVAEETPRTFRLFVPNSYDDDTPTPVVIGLHGKTGNGGNQAWVSDFNSIARREGIITLYPDGLANEWNYIRGIPETFPGIDDYSDEDFIYNLLDDLAGELNIDLNRIYVTGFSNGGFMAQRLACLSTDRFAAFASVAATGTYELTAFCNETQAVPIMYIQGTADRIVPWEGQLLERPNGNSFYVSQPMDQTINFWAFHNGCSMEDLDIEDLPQVDSETKSRIIRAVDCLDYAPVVLVMIANGGHVWPGVRDIQNPVFGLSTKDFNATEVIWDFFKQYSLEDRAE